MLVAFVAMQPSKRECTEQRAAGAHVDGDAARLRRAVTPVLDHVVPVLAANRLAVLAGRKLQPHRACEQRKNSNGKFPLAFNTSNNERNLNTARKSTPDRSLKQFPQHVQLINSLRLASQETNVPEETVTLHPASDNKGERATAGVSPGLVKRRVMSDSSVWAVMRLMPSFQVSPSRDGYLWSAQGSPFRSATTCLSCRGNKSRWLAQDCKLPLTE